MSAQKEVEEAVAEALWEAKVMMAVDDEAARALGEIKANGWRVSTDHIPKWAVRKLLRVLDGVAEAKRLEARVDPGAWDIANADIGDMLDTEPEPPPEILRGVLLLGIVAMDVGSGGSGKSMMTNELAWCISTKTPFYGVPVVEEGGVLIVSAEDSKEIAIHPRLSVIRKRWEREGLITEENRDHVLGLLKKNLKILDRTAFNNMLTAKTAGAVHQTDIPQKIIDMVSEFANLKLIILDPLSRFDGGEVNDNADATRLIEAAEKIRKETGATVLLTHHVSKSSMRDQELGQEMARGASALVDGARWVAAMRTMTPKEAAELNVSPDDAERFVRLRSIKSNYTAPWKGVWLQRGEGGALSLARFESDHVSREERAQEEYSSLLTRIRALLEEKGPLAVRDIEGLYAGLNRRLKASDKSVRKAIRRALDEGDLIEKVDGRRKLVDVTKKLFD